MKRGKYGRTFKGYVALEREGGPVIWGTLRPDAAETRRIFNQWNPMITPIIKPIRMSIEGENSPNS